MAHGVAPDDFDSGGSIRASDSVKTAVDPGGPV